MLSLRFLRFPKICAILFIISLLFSCSGMLNDIFEDSSDKIADAAGVVYPTTTESSTVSATLPTADSYIVYSFEKKEGVTYNINWTNGDGAKMSVDVDYEKSLSHYHTSGSYSYTAYSSGTMYITVVPYNSSYTGSFSLTISCKNQDVSLRKYEPLLHL